MVYGLAPAFLLAGLVAFVRLYYFFVIGLRFRALQPGMKSRYGGGEVEWQQAGVELVWKTGHEFEAFERSKEGQGCQLPGRACVHGLCRIHWLF